MRILVFLTFENLIEMELCFSEKYLLESERSRIERDLNSSRWIHFADKHYYKRTSFSR